MKAERRERLLVETAACGARLDHYLVQSLAGVSRKAVKRALDGGQVFIDGRCAGRAGILLAGGERIELTIAADLLPVAPPSLAILWQNDDLLAIDKPASLPSHPTVAGRANALDLVSALLAADGVAMRPILLHRLDADTTGVLLFALTREANLALSRQFSDHRIEKTYLALVAGAPPAHFAVENHLRAGVRGRTEAVTSGGLAARTDFRTLASSAGIALVEALPRTGRTHQIRAHLAGAGYPLLGDPLYGGPLVVTVQGAAVAVRRHLLHARALAFAEPQSGARLMIEAPLPEDFRQFLPALGEW